MPGNLKNALRAEPAGGTVNVDLTRTTPKADPRFMPEQAPPESDSAMDAPGLTVTGKSPNARIALPASQKLPNLPPARNPNLFEATPRKRT